MKGGSEKQKIKFYTDLWHALLGRRIVSDVDGKYLDTTGDTPVTVKLLWTKEEILGLIIILMRYGGVIGLLIFFGQWFIRR